MGALSPQQVLRVLTIVIAVIVLSATSVPSLATGSPSNAELREAIKALEARVVALEAQLQQKTDSQQEASIPRPTLVALGEQAPAYSPMSLGNQHQPVPQLTNNGWSGFYWGTSFGVGSASSSSRYRSVSHDHDENQNEDTDVDVEDDGSIDISSNSSTSISDTTSFVEGLTSADETNGALADLYLGGNARLAPRIIAGLQVEGSLAQMAFRSRVRGEKSTSESTDTYTSQSASSCCSSQDTDTSHEVSSDQNRFDALNEVELNWMVSVIGRAGILATPSTFLYGLAGWSYGHFEVDELMWDFGLGKIADYDSDGLTFGGGFEQKLSSKWSIRGEYRHTDFGTEHFSTRGRFTSTDSDSAVEQGSDTFTSDNGTSSSSDSGSGKSKSFDEDTITAKGSIENDMHVGRIGVTRYFTLGD